MTPEGLCTKCSATVVCEEHRPPRRNRPTQCRWTYDDIDDAWDTACENKHCFITDGPRENGYTFCPYCGGTIKKGAPR